MRGPGPEDLSEQEATPRSGGVRQPSASERRSRPVGRCPRKRSTPTRGPGAGYTVLEVAPDGPEHVSRARLGIDGRAARILWDAGLEAQQSRALTGLEVEGSAFQTWASARWSGRVGSADRSVLEVGAGARAQGSLRGTTAFLEAWDRVPGSRAWIETSVRPDARLALWARLEGVGASDWPRGRLPSYVLLDLGLSKRAWGDRLRLSLGGRNVLGSREQTHPLGATLGPRLFVRAQASL